MKGMFFGRYSELAERLRQLEKPRPVHHQLSERALRGWLAALANAWEPRYHDGGGYLEELGIALGEFDTKMAEACGREMLTFLRPLP